MEQYTPKIAFHVHRDAANRERVQRQEGKKDHRLDRIFCTCGYQGKPAWRKVVEENVDCRKVQVLRRADPDEVDAFEAERADLDAPTQLMQVQNLSAVPVNRKYVEVEPKFTVKGEVCCPTCGNETFRRISLNGPKPTLVLHNCNLWNNMDREKKPGVALTFTWGEYYYNATADKIIYKQRKARITWNAESRRTFISGNHKRGWVRELTYAGFDSNDYTHTLASVLSGAKDELGVKVHATVNQWIALTAELAGLKYLDLSPFYVSNLPETFVFVKGLALFLRFPALQNLPFRHYGKISPELRELMKRNPSTQEMWTYLAGTNRKSSRQWVVSEEHLRIHNQWVGVINEPNNLVRLLEAQEEAWRLSRNMKGRRDRENVPRIPRANIHGSPSVMPAAALSDESTKHLFDWFRSLHQDEAHMVRCITRCRQPIIDWDHNNNQRVITGYYIFDLDWVRGQIQDTKRLYDSINRAVEASIQDETEENPRIHYEFNYRGDIYQFHEDLSRDFGRMRHRNQIIHYTDRERAWQMCIGGYEFILARDTHTLIDVGNSMNICVGGYGDHALEKHCNIVLVYHEGELKFCIELNPGDTYHVGSGALSYSLGQVKKHYNTYGTKGELEPVAQWLDLIGVKDWRTSYDMRGYTDESMSETVAAENERHLAWRRPRPRQELEVAQVGPDF